MAGPSEPGGSGPDTTTDGGERESSSAPVSSSRASTGRIPGLTPLKSVDGPTAPAKPASGPLPFRPNVTAYWTPSASASGQGGHSGFIRIATPVAARPDGVVSVISPRAPALSDKSDPVTAPQPSSAVAEARAGVVSISAGSPAAYPETPPFGISQLAGAVAARAGEKGEGVPSRVAEVRSGRIPFRVGEYEVATRLAQGGTGSIYICRRVKRPQALFTLKVIRQHAMQKDAAVFAFQREARVGKLLHHPNAITVLDEGNYEGQPFLILPYVEGGNLSALLSGDVRADPANVVTVLLDVLRALQHAHRLTNEGGQPLNLVHGDISPDNILVGTDGTARITDFGSARLAENPGGEPEVFGLGKPSYMSPEQLRGEPLDARSDLFSVGIVMWSALTGQKLFAAESYDQTVMRVMRRKIPAPSSLGAPPQLDEVCLQALSRSPAGRFASADEMSDALMTAAVKANLVATRDQLAQWVRRDMGEALGERRRRVENMFGDKAKVAGPPVQIETIRPRQQSTPITGVSPAATIQMNAMLRGGELTFGAAKNAASARTLFVPAAAKGETKLSRSQWYVVFGISLVTFFLTLVVGTWLSRAAGVRHGSPSVAPATVSGAALPSAPSAAVLPKP